MQMELPGMPARLVAVQWVFRYENAGVYSATCLKLYEGQGWHAEQRYVGLSASELIDVLDAATAESVRGMGQL